MSGAGHHHLNVVNGMEKNDKDHAGMTVKSVACHHSYLIQVRFMYVSAETKGSAEQR